MKLKNNILAFVIIGALGALFHFVYEWTGEAFLAGLFFPTSESTWEHLKLIFYPTLLYSVFECISLNEKPKNYLVSIAAGIFAGKLTITSLFYIYSGILGFNVDFINISIFYIAVLVLLIVKKRIINSFYQVTSTLNIISAIYLILCALLFGVWSYNPPSLGIFTPPIL